MMKKKGPCLTGWRLHSYRLKFTDADGKIIDLEAALPKDISALLQQLKKN